MIIMRVSSDDLFIACKKSKKYLIIEWDCTMSRFDAGVRFAWVNVNK